MITPLMIYLIGVLDGMRNLFRVSALVAALVAVVMTIFAGISYGEYDKWCQSSKRWMRRALAILVFSAAACAAIPSTKLAAAMYIIPAVANNEDVKTIGGNSLEALRKLTEKWLLELSGEKSAKQHAVDDGQHL